MNIILIGMRGSGKSTIGKILSKKMNKPFYDLDDLLAQKTKMSIPELIEKYDWDYFRDRESEIVEEISQKTNAVISPGGGAIIREENIKALKRDAKFVLLKTPIAELIKRIGKGKNRPTLTKGKSFIDEMEDVWNERRTVYEQTADMIIETNNKTAKEVAQEIIKHL